MHYNFLYKAFLFLLCTSPCFAYQPNQMSIITGGLDAHIAQSRESFEAIYYQMVEKGLFPVSYNNNLIVNLDLSHDAQKEGVILLRLIEWLETQDDAHSALLLEKINYLYFLEFHSFLARMDLKKDAGSKMLALCQDLYHYAIQGTQRTPFRSSLSKLFLMICIINETQVHYEERKETLAFALEGIKRDMLAINHSLELEKIDNEIIKTFVTLLDGYAAREPVIQRHNLRNIILLSTTILVVGFLIYKYQDDIGGYVSEFFNSLFNKFFEKSGKGVAKGMMEELYAEENEEKLKKTTENAARSAIRGMAKGASVDGKAQEANPDLDAIAESLGKNIYESVSKASKDDVAKINQVVDAKIGEVTDQLNKLNKNAEGFQDQLGRLRHPVSVRDIPWVKPPEQNNAQQNNGNGGNADANAQQNNAQQNNQNANAQEDAEDYGARAGGFFGGWF